MRAPGFVLIFPLLAVCAAAIAQDEGPGFIHFEAADVPFTPEKPELGSVILSGDPGAAGIYVMRLRIPPGRTFRPHYHDQDRHVTVISGVWAFGTGDSGKCEDTIPLLAGAYVLHPKGAVHYDGACGDDWVEVQIIGQGPVTTTWIGKTD